MSLIYSLMMYFYQIAIFYTLKYLIYLIGHWALRTERIETYFNNSSLSPVPNPQSLVPI